MLTAPRFLLLRVATDEFVGPYVSVFFTSDDEAEVERRFRELRESDFLYDYATIDLATIGKEPSQ